MATAGGTARFAVMIDEREPLSESAAVTVLRPRTGARSRSVEPRSPDAPSSSISPSPSAPSPSAPAAPHVPERRPARGVTHPPEDAADFPGRLARAMQAAARSHRIRVTEEVELRRVAVLAAIRDERRADALRAQQAAAKNGRAVDAWAATAQRQIKGERQRRKAELAADLRRTLREQNRQVERRVKRVEAALAAHRAELDAFFDAIDRERDPLTIAQRARRRPAFPDLEATMSPPPAQPSATE